ncbi:hypothetical protein [Desulfotomaculum copahuensis]|uniref:Uncharacterized protein n=1 Tax=Desulfotomaculum copahuensis TaxID=1838280 RepID=A0A1B7LAP0_9FIRM|nr:hypothetical protein [Desulfotomaculum copahuensis]OAT79412.1 hypothetical protein A6M21_01390 [Desulfotomaculum copahuensis]
MGWYLVKLLLNWPVIIASLLIGAAGIIRRRAYALILAALLVFGFAWYLTASPHPVFKPAGYLLPVLLLCAAFSVHQRKVWLAWLFLLPQAVITIYFLVIIAAENI